MWLAGMGDTALPHWHCSRWWMMPCWTSLRGASHDCSFQGALLHTAAWETAWKLISINSQPSSRTISKHNFRAVQHYYFSTSSTFWQWTGWVMLIWWIWQCCQNNMNLAIIATSSGEAMSCKSRKIQFFMCLISLVKNAVGFLLLDECCWHRQPDVCRKKFYNANKIEWYNESHAHMREKCHVARRKTDDGVIILLLDCSEQT